jgi:hypothetical protein
MGESKKDALRVDFGEIIDVIHRKLCLLSVQMGNSSSYIIMQSANG